MSPKYVSEPQKVVLEYTYNIYASDFAGRVRFFHKNNVKPCAPRVAALFEKLPLSVKAIVGDTFTYEQFQQMAEVNTYPEFYVQFERRQAQNRDKIMTRKQARQLLPRYEDDKLEIPEYIPDDDDDWDDPTVSFAEWYDDY